MQFFPTSKRMRMPDHLVSALIRIGTNLPDVPCIICETPDI
jgi:hypothetical protein